MLKKLLTATLLFFLMLPVAGALAQTGTVTGVVTDSTSGETLPGVNIRVEGTQLGAATGPSGQYEIAGVPTGMQTVQASFVGYRSKEVTVQVAEGINEVNIELPSSAVALQDVVVTALGVEREKSSLGYSVQEVEGDEINQVPQSDLVGALQGKIAGASFQNSNALGGSSRIVLRGPNSIGGNNQPLFVVDGIPINNNNFTGLAQAYGGGGYDFGNAASEINPADIASVSVLKGPAASALYGSRGANGVIQITTKSGRGTEGIGVRVNTSVMASDVYGLPNYQNRYGGGGSTNFTTLNGDNVMDGSLNEVAAGVDFNGDGKLEKSVADQRVANYGTDESWGPRLDGRDVRQWYSWDDVNGKLGQATPWVGHPDNIKNFYKTGAEFNTTVALQQSSDEFSYRLSLSNQSNTGVEPNQDRMLNKVSFNGSADLGPELTATANANYSALTYDGLPITGYSGINTQFNHFGQRQVNLGEGSYMYDYQRPNGAQRGWNWLSSGAARVGVLPGQDSGLIYANNPYWDRNENYASNDRHRIYGKAGLAWDFINDFTLSGTVRTDRYTERRQERTAVGSALGGNSDAGAYGEDVFEVSETSVVGRLDYGGQLSEDFSLDAFGATEYRYNDQSQNLGSTAGGLSARNVYTLDNSVSRPNIVDYYQQKGVVSLYGSANLGWRDLLFLDLTARNDWSSTLPTDNNSYFYPSASLSFAFSRLPGLQDADALSFGKLRVAYARVGSDTDPYNLALTYPLGTPYDGSPVQSLPEELPNSGLEPEITSAWEIGTQLQFFNNRLGLDATYYDRQTKNQILSVGISDASGFSSSVVNAGKVSNKGVELSLTATPVLAGDFQWDLSVNWAKNVNKVESLEEGVQAYTIGPSIFGPNVQARVGEPVGTFYGSDFVYDANGNKVVDPSGTYLSSDDKALGNYQPDWTGGLSTTLSYKGITASIGLNGQKGGQVYSLMNTWGHASGLLDNTTDGNVRQLGVVPTDAVYFPKNFDSDPNNDIDDVSQAKGTPFTDRVNAQHYFSAFYGGPHAMRIYDASFIKLREARIGYTLPQQWLASLPIQNLTISAIGRNLAMLYKETPNFDPSVALSAGNLQGIEAGPIAPRRRYGMSVRLNF